MRNAMNGSRDASLAFVGLSTDIWHASGLVLQQGYPAN